MPIDDITIIAGNSRVAGLRAPAAPERTKSTVMPTTATSMRTGSNRIIGFGGIARGTSGGASTTTSAPEIAGPATRGPGCHCGMRLPSRVHVCAASGYPQVRRFSTSGPQLRSDCGYRRLGCCRTEGKRMSSKLASDICRVAVQTEAGRLDLVLPANIVVAALIPPLVDLISPTAQGRAAADWQLSRIGDGPISARHSLADNDVHDGDLLLLQAGSGAVAPKPQGDVIVGIPGSLDRFPRWDTTARRAAGLIISVCSSGFTAFALLQGDRHVGALLAAAVAVAAFSGAVACGRVYRERLSAVALGVCAVVTAAVAGYLVVPGQELAPKAMLAAA